jgi:hypothetical protein
MANQMTSEPTPDFFTDPATLTTSELARVSASSARRTATTPPAPVDERVGQVARYPQPGESFPKAGVGDASFSPSPSLDERNITSIEGYEEFKPLPPFPAQALAFAR